jgi:glycosyltransferase involved in cell wall biosynthesis
MNNSPQLSIIITTYNRKLKVNRAIESAVSEAKGKNVEIIVVDDASTDNTEASIQNFIDRGEIRYIKHSVNKGVCVTKNKGVELAKAELVTFLDSDDTFIKGAIEQILHFFENTNKDVDAFMGRCRRRDKIKFLEPPVVVGIISYLTALKLYFMGDYLYVVKKKVFEKTPFLPNLLAFESIQILEALKSGCVFYYDSAIMLDCDYSSPDRLSATAFKRSENMVEGFHIFMQKFGADYKKVNFTGYIYIILKMFVFSQMSKDLNIKRGLLSYPYITTLLKFLFYPVFFVPRELLIYFYSLGVKFTQPK